MNIKICGLAEPAAAELALELGATVAAMLAEDAG